MAPRKEPGHSLPSRAAGATDERANLGAGTQGRIVAALDGVDAFLGGVAQPVDLGLIFLLTLFEQAQSLANNFAGIAELAGLDAGSK